MASSAGVKRGREEEAGQATLAVEVELRLVGAGEVVAAQDRDQGRERAGGANEGAGRLFRVLELLAILAAERDVAVCLNRKRGADAVGPALAKLPLRQIDRVVGAGEGEGNAGSGQLEVGLGMIEAAGRRVDRVGQLFGRILAVARAERLAPEQMGAAVEPGRVEVAGRDLEGVVASPGPADQVAARADRAGGHVCRCWSGRRGGRASWARCQRTRHRRTSGRRCCPSSCRAS